MTAPSSEGAPSPGRPDTFEPDAEGDATRSVPLASRRDTAGDVRRQMAGREYEAPNQIVVLDGEAFAGMVPLKRVLDADPGAAMEDLMTADPPVFMPGASHEAVGHSMVSGGYSDAIVADAQGRFVGVVPGHLLLRGLLAAHDEDLARLGGYLAGTRRARHAAEEPIKERLWHRLPWLIVGLA